MIIDSVVVAAFALDARKNSKTAKGLVIFMVNILRGLSG